MILIYVERRTRSRYPWRSIRQSFRMPCF